MEPIDRVKVKVVKYNRCRVKHVQFINQSINPYLTTLDVFEIRVRRCKTLINVIQWQNTIFKNTLYKQKQHYF